MFTQVMSKRGSILPYTIICITFLCSLYLLNTQKFQSKMMVSQDLTTAYEAMILSELAEAYLVEHQENDSVKLTYNVGEVQCRKKGKEWQLEVRLNDSEMLYRSDFRK